MKAKVLIIVTMVFATIAVKAQIFKSSETGMLSNDYSFMKSKPVFGMQVGSSFTTGFGGGYFTQSVSPHITFQPGKNFSLLVGTRLSTGSFTGASSFSPGVGGQQRLNSTMIYALGAYQLNPRLIMSGAAWTERNNMPSMFSPQMNPQAFNTNSSGMMLGLDFRVSEKFSIGAQMNVSQGYNPFNPMQNNSFPYSPFSPRR